MLLYKFIKTWTFRKISESKNNKERTKEEK